VCTLKLKQNYTLKAIDRGLRGTGQLQAQEECFMCVLLVVDGVMAVKYVRLAGG